MDTQQRHMMGTSLWWYSSMQLSHWNGWLVNNIVKFYLQEWLVWLCLVSVCSVIQSTCHHAWKPMGRVDTRKEDSFVSMWRTQLFLAFLTKQWCFSLFLSHGIFFAIIYISLCRQHTNSNWMLTIIYVTKRQLWKLKHVYFIEIQISHAF